MAAVMRQGTKAQSGGLVTGPDWSASQVIQSVDLSALLHWLGASHVLLEIIRQDGTISSDVKEVLTKWHSDFSACFKANN